MRVSCRLKTGRLVGKLVAILKHLEINKFVRSTNSQTVKRKDEKLTGALGSSNLRNGVASSALDAEETGAAGHLSPL
jgi:hypothetical protein